MKHISRLRVQDVSIQYNILQIGHKYHSKISYLQNIIIRSISYAWLHSTIKTIKKGGHIDNDMLPYTRNLPHWGINLKSNCYVINSTKQNVLTGLNFDWYQLNIDRASNGTGVTAIKIAIASYWIAIWYQFSVSHTGTVRHWNVQGINGYQIIAIAFLSAKQASASYSAYKNNRFNI